MAAVNQLLDHVATYPNNAITYRASDIILDGHSDESYIKKSNARSQSGAHIFLSEDEPVPKLNGPALTIAQIIKLVMFSVAEANLVGLFIASK